MEFSVIFKALSYGLLPAFVWLIFWLYQDRERPEPKKIIAGAFLAGMLAVPLAVTIEIGIEQYVSHEFLKTFLWALTEESMKYILAVIFVFHTRAFDEALDALIYMVCVALGFAALENTLYALEPLVSTGDVATASLTSLRFVGATLVHIVSSAAIGVAMAMTFYKREAERAVAVIVGLVIATSLHALFNFLIIQIPLEAVFIVFALVWIAVLGLILIAERIKRLDAHYTARF